MKDDGCLFSVIIPLYNKEKCIARTINSVLSQSYTNFEIVIVDDGSTDNSAAIVKTITDSRIRLFQKENGGVSSARNYGTRKACGEWILFLDADDVLLPNSLRKMYNVLLSCSNINVISGNYKIISKEGERLYHNRSYRGIVPYNYKWYFFNKYSMRTGCFLIRNNIVYNNLFNESLSRFEDMEFILRILKNCVIYIIPDIVLEYHCENNSLSKIRKGNDKNKDFTFSMFFKNKNFWEKCKLGELLYLASFSYPNESKRLRNIYGSYYLYKYYANIIKKTYKLYHFLWH